MYIFFIRAYIDMWIKWTHRERADNLSSFSHTEDECYKKAGAEEKGIYEGMSTPKNRMKSCHADE